MEHFESRDRYGYCDWHLEAALVPFGTWLAGQYGGDNADCNPFQYWRCSRPECDRCYDPNMGYLNLNRQPGWRIESGAENQERCGRHADMPFMVIGRFGQARKFRCPVHGCDNVGSLVAENVADVDYPQEPQGPPTSLTAHARKEAFELSTFLDFAAAAQLPVISPQNAEPPHPDIRCKIDGEEYWFELGRITDSNVARAVSIDWPTDPTPFSIAQKEPFVRIIKKKAAAKYETNGGPVDLVLHFDQQPPDRTALNRHLKECAASLSDLCLRGPFSRIWIYDKWSKALLWKGT